jgi:hypothetical protein
MNDFPIYKFTLSLKLDGPLRAPRFKGSMLRGAMGHQLKRVACVSSDSDCDACPVTKSCPYFVSFETRGLFDGNQRDLPHPYLINCKDERRELKKGGSLTFDLILMGSHVRNLPYFLTSFIRAGASKGLTRDEIGFEVISVKNKGTEIYDAQSQCLLEDQTPAPDPVEDLSPADSLEINLLTPTRIRSNKRYVGKELESLDFLKCLYHTMEGLQPYLGNLSLPSKTDFFGRSSELKIQNKHLRWQPVIRHSNRQRKKIAMGGVMGSFQLQGKLIEEIVPYLSLLPLTNLGKNRVFGLGQVEISFPKSGQNEVRWL